MIAMAICVGCCKDFQYVDESLTCDDCLDDAIDDAETCVGEAQEYLEMLRRRNDRR